MPTLPAPPVLQLAPLHFAHPGEPPLFDGLSLSLGPGLHCLQGDAGSGKTTLLQLLGGDLPGLGEAHLNGRPAVPGSAAWRAAVCHADLRGDGCDDLTPAALMAAMRQRHPALDPAAWQRHIDGFGLAPHAAKTLFMLSTGMRRKATLAAMLASGATLLLLDEPTAGLDAPSTAWLVQALNTRAALPSCTTLMVSGRWPPGLAMAGQVLLTPHTPAS
jgi:ABC-type multidrug transport system ATPase subunit